MTREEAATILYYQWQGFLENNIDYAGISEAYKMAIEALKQEPKTGHWTSISEGYPPIEDEYKLFLVIDAKGEVSVQKLYVSLDKERRPYFSGMINPVSWKPLLLP